MDVGQGPCTKRGSIVEGAMIALSRTQAIIHPHVTLHPHRTLEGRTRVIARHVPPPPTVRLKTAKSGWQAAALVQPAARSLVCVRSFVSQQQSSTLR